jgi:hypothetical protein
MAQTESVTGSRQLKAGHRMLSKQFPTDVPVMEAARADVLALLHFPQKPLRKI